MFENRGNIIDEWGKIMKIENIMKMLEVFWPIAIAIYCFFIYKFIPYMKTKIFINKIKKKRKKNKKKKNKKFKKIKKKKD